ncbi:IS66 family insertion sequence element accessory protein TnpB [Thalassomonas viridans]|uniref:IS66 family insertion sequence element accessory protein TnpB n=1 Tax=Thalassomonas viridans TaxID=137584 RepID=A0AAF0CDG4_9GAMM|nr:hypothetical protein [Thalassomonas viridans]WDE05036.1 IS66 family insertion sequence element accessory protein TnpB [Thalassomonas viridans]WDE07830.1 IS66 family insertion sequence element accessory protein TnpB [Thalassomonas viridans]WDE08661.1 IS66 family insertion sequence element accessory protein TnpB [Thalassomonas viridans]WDE08791.1 IS66 family insertion sequence element accessory protein TnpB [Thalassomonas viridans]WDE09110.1 IS66 family insertion sequence element accessory pr
MRTYRNPAQWRTLIEAQAESGLTITQYCQQQGCSTNAFYAQRAKLFGKQAQDSKLIKATLTQQVEVSCQELNPVTLTVGDITLSLPGSTPPAYIIEVIRGLA